MTRRGRGDGSLFKRKDGYWVGSVELPAGPNGVRRRKTVASKNRNEAMRKLRELQAEVAAGTIATATTTTVGKWLDYWLESIVPHRGIRPGTLKSYANTVRPLRHRQGNL